MDDWAEMNSIVIDLPIKVASLTRQRNNDSYRGSFGPIVTTARMQSVKKVMRNMFNGQGWKISIANNLLATNKDDYTCKAWGKDN